MKFLILAAILLIAAPALAQVSLKEGLKVNDIALGTKYTDVVRKLGKPTRDVTNKKIDECMGSHVRTLTYPGLTIELDDGGVGFTVFSFEVTSAKYDVSGVRVGTAADAIQKRFGTKGRTVEKNKAELTWYYEMSDESPGSSNFRFRGGKLVKVVSTYMMC
jgi:hypothetical protein